VSSTNARVLRISERRVPISHLSRVGSATPLLCRFRRFTAAHPTSCAGSLNSSSIQDVECRFTCTCITPIL